MPQLSSETGHLGGLILKHASWIHLVIGAAGKSQNGEFVNLHLRAETMVINHVPVEVLIIQHFFNEYGLKTHMETRRIEETLPI